MLSPWIAAIVGMATAMAAHDIQYAVGHDAPWSGHGDDKWDWGDFMKGQTQSGTIGGTLGYAGGYLGGTAGTLFGGADGVLGGAAGTAAGALSGGAEGAASGTAAGTLGAIGSDAAGMTLAEGASGLGDIIGSNVGSIAADAGAATPTGIAGIVPQSTANILQAAETGSKPLIQETLKRAVLNGATGALQDQDNPGRGALMGAAGGLASGAFSGAANGIGSAFGPDSVAPNSLPTRSFTLNNPSGEFAYRPSATGFSLGGTTATPPPGLLSRLGTAGVGLGSRIAGGAASQMVGGAMTTQPTTYNPNPYMGGYVPYWARSRMI